MSLLFYYKIAFITEILIAELMFSFKMERRKLFPLRAILSLIVCYSVAIFYPLAFYSGWYASLMFFAFFLCAYFALFSCFKASLINAFYIAIASYTVQHLSYEFFSLISKLISSNLNLYSSVEIDFSNLSEETLFMLLIYLQIHIVIYVASYFIFGKRINKSEKIRINNFQLFILACSILVIDIVINAFVVYIDSEANFSYEIIISIYNIICCLFVLFFQFSAINAKKMEQEIKTTHSLLIQARRQYDLSRENIDAINMKVHNLKHQINEFARRKDIADQSIKEIENMISIYDAPIKTGNEALDIILTEKSLLCHNKHIKLTCMADGKCLSFINESDLYVLFGNALDNAIESVSKIDDEEKKIISMSVYLANSLISININNYYDGELEMDDNGIPKTTKTDKDNHGYGVKSIKMIAENYGGDFSIVLKDHIFNMNILLPVQK